MTHELNRDSDQTACANGLRLDRELCRVFHVAPEESDRLVRYVCETLAGVICRHPVVDVLGFGSFKVKLYRPIRPARVGDDSFVEAPYLGPVEFAASALLVRQIRSRALERSVVPRCDLLYSAIRKDNWVQRGQIPVLIKGVFKALTAALITDNLVALPGIGCLVVRRRPPVVRYNAETEKVEVLPGDPTLFLRLASPFLVRIPARVRRDAGEVEARG